jgi:hypothetical protein
MRAAVEYTQSDLVMALTKLPAANSKFQLNLSLSRTHDLVMAHACNCIVHLVLRGHMVSEPLALRHSFAGLAPSQALRVLVRYKSRRIRSNSH